MQKQVQIVATAVETGNARMAAEAEPVAVSEALPGQLRQHVVRNCFHAAGPPIN
jgi:hypothetical protein